MKKINKKSKLRVRVGKVFFTLKKYWDWYLSGKKFAKKQVLLKEKFLDIEIFTHQTVLLRKLKDLDMWMQFNKINNLRIAVPKLNGLIIEPGETFSYWRQIGTVTRAKGYVEGMLLHNGKVVPGVGGGLCQLSNLIFWITLHTPLTVIERWRHGYDVFPDVNRTQPFGSGATCSYPYIDLQIKNNTNQKFQLFLEVTDTHLVGKWFSDKTVESKYHVFEKNHKINLEWWGGYSRNNEIFRNVIDSSTNKEVKEEFIASNHALMMYDPLLED